MSDEMPQGEEERRATRLYSHFLCRKKKPAAETRKVSPGFCLGGRLVIVFSIQDIFTF